MKTCMLCGQDVKIKRVVKPGDFVQRHDGIVGLVSFVNSQNGWLTVTVVGSGIIVTWPASEVDLLHGIFHITERIAP
jgi:hypothetical protein